ncbi:DUF2461 domain-containing protein [Fulvivirgaceae bacterium BMA10]|uniref:DUF2461 domain-containing protein n=1 Tax=Splendidivirga corallicola TaxID=3051826 RepID=A0ABT8KJ84_9BACT|nr:DUF2461 domain-containing protein [Fulvivirgaceae bacterium BMA10]
MNTEIILNFLKDLKANNNRDWFIENKKIYQAARTEFQDILKALIDGIGKFDDRIQDLEPKDCMFRINRDIRFSKDKSPYKTNFGGVIAQGGKKSPNPCYYLHFEPGNVFLAGGIYMPEANILKKIRQEIDYNAKVLKNVIEKPAFRKLFGEIEGDKLKKAPKDYAIDHPDIELLKLKSYIIIHRLANGEPVKKDFIESCLKIYKMMKPYNDFLTVAVSD